MDVKTEEPLICKHCHEFVNGAHRPEAQFENGSGSWSDDGLKPLVFSGRAVVNNKKGNLVIVPLLPGNKPNTTTLHFYARAIDQANLDDFRVDLEFEELERLKKFIDSEYEHATRPPETTDLMVATTSDGTGTMESTSRASELRRRARQRESKKPDAEDVPFTPVD